MTAAAAVLALSLAAVDALAASSAARPATRSERVAIVKALAASDGNISSLVGVYVSRSNQSLAVVCQRTPEAGVQAIVFGHVHGSWRYLTSGPVGRAGNSADRRLEHACP